MLTALYCLPQLPRIASARTLLRPSIWLLLGLLGGCGSVAAPPLAQTVPAHWQERPLTHAPGPAPDLHSWWRLLDEPALNALVDKALANNLNLAQARSNLRQARLLAGHDNNSYRPYLSLGARPSQEVSAMDTYYQISLDTHWELGLFGAREATQQGGQARFELSEADTRSACVSIVAEVVRQYVDLRNALHQQALAQRIAQMDAQGLALLHIQSQQQLGAQDAQHQLQLRLNQIQVQSNEFAQAAERAAQALAVLLGRPKPDATWSAPEPAEQSSPLRLPAFSLTQLPIDLLIYRPDIRRAQAQVLQAFADLGSARADLYPRITLGASLLYAHNLTQNRRTRSNAVPSVGPLIDIPLFDWGRRKAVADARQAAQEASALAYRQAVLEGIAETENALSSLQYSTQQSQYLQASQETLEQQSSKQATLVRLGLTGPLEQLAAERASVQARMGLASAEVARTHAFIALYKSLGGAPWPVDSPTAAVTEGTP